MQRSANPPEVEAGFSVPNADDRAAWGREGARRRWGDHVPRVVNLAGLTPEKRRLVLAFVEMARASDERSDTAPEAA